MMGLDVTHQACSKPARPRTGCAGLGTRSGAVGAELADYALQRRAWYGTPRMSVHDAAPSPISPSLSSSTSAAYDVRSTPGRGPARGRTVCDGLERRVERQGRKLNAQVGIRMDRDRFEDILVDAYSRCRRPATSSFGVAARPLAGALALLLSRLRELLLLLQRDDGSCDPVVERRAARMHAGSGPPLRALGDCTRSGLPSSRQSASRTSWRAPAAAGPRREPRRKRHLARPDRGRASALASPTTRRCDDPHRGERRRPGRAGLDLQGQPRQDPPRARRPRRRGSDPRRHDPRLHRDPAGRGVRRPGAAVGRDPRLQLADDAAATASGITVSTSRHSLEAATDRTSSERRPTSGVQYGRWVERCALVEALSPASIGGGWRRSD